MINIIGISGSLRNASFNSALLRLAGQLMPQGHELNIISLGDLPLYNEDMIPSEIPDSVDAFRSAIQQADGLLIACPEYNYSLTGVLKNAFDWAGTDTIGNLFTHKPVAMMGASRTISGTIRAQLHLRQVLLAAGANIVSKPEVYFRQAHKIVDREGEFSDERSKEKVSALLEALVKQIAAGA